MTKITVNLSEADAAALKAIAAERGVSFSQALRQAIATERWLAGEREAGGKVLIERNGEIRELVFR